MSECEGRGAYFHQLHDDAGMSVVLGRAKDLADVGVRRRPSAVGECVRVSTASS